MLLYGDRPFSFYVQTGTLLCSPRVLWACKMGRAGQGFGNLCCLAQLTSVLPSLMAQLCCDLAPEDSSANTGYTQPVFAEGELHVSAEGFCGTAAARACPGVVEERERFFSFGIGYTDWIVPQHWPLWGWYFVFTKCICSVMCVNFSFLLVVPAQNSQLLVPTILSFSITNKYCARFVSNFSKAFLVQLLFKYIYIYIHSKQEKKTRQKCKK